MTVTAFNEEHSSIDNGFGNARSLFIFSKGFIACLNSLAKIYEICYHISIENRCAYSMPNGGVLQAYKSAEGRKF